MLRRKVRVHTVAIEHGAPDGVVGHLEVHRPRVRSGVTVESHLPTHPPWSAFAQHAEGGEAALKVAGTTNTVAVPAVSREAVGRVAPTQWG